MVDKLSKAFLARTLHLPTNVVHSWTGMSLGPKLHGEWPNNVPYFVRRKIHRRRYYYQHDVINWAIQNTKRPLGCIDVPIKMGSFGIGFKYVPPSEAAISIGVTEAELAEWREDGFGPAWLEFPTKRIMKFDKAIDYGHTIRYHSDVVGAVRQSGFSEIRANQVSEVNA